MSGPHPAKGVLAVRRLTIRKVARQLGRNEQVVARMLAGTEPASRPFRAQLARLLDLPESVLFDESRKAGGAA